MLNYKLIDFYCGFKHTEPRTNLLEIKLTLVGSFKTFDDISLFWNQSDFWSQENHQWKVMGINEEVKVKSIKAFSWKKLFHN